MNGWAESDINGLKDGHKIDILMDGWDRADINGWIEAFDKL